MLYIDRNTVVSNNVYQAHTRRTGTIDLAAGYHDIDIGFYEGGGLNSLTVDWAGPGINGTENIPNSVLVPVPSDTPAYDNSAIFNNPVLVPQSSTINSGAAAVPSLNLSVGKTLTVNGYRFSTGALTLNGGAGTYTFNTNTLFGETTIPSIVDGGAAVAIVKNGPGTLVFEAGANPQLTAATSITATAGGLGVVLGSINPTGNATVNVNGLSLVVSSKGGDQSWPLPAFSNGGSITARQIGDGVAGTTGTPIRTTLTGNLALNSGTTLNLGSADNYILGMAGISGNATINVAGTVATSGVVNVGGPLNVVSSTLTAAQSVSAGPVTVTNSTVTAPGVTSTGAVNITGSTFTSSAGISGTGITIANSNVINTGNIAAGAPGITINGGATVPSVLELRGGSISGGPIAAQGAVIHVPTGTVNAATNMTFTGLNPSGFFARFVTRADNAAGSVWPAQTENGISNIEHYNGPRTVEKALTTALSFLPYQAADATITAFFDGAVTEPNQFAIGFFASFTAPVTGQYSMQVTQVDDDAGWWVDLDNDGVFESGAGATNGNELIAQRNCCGDSAVGTVDLNAGQVYKVAVAVEDGQGGSSLVGMIGLPGEGLQVIDPSNPVQDGWWHYGLPNQVTIDDGGTLNIEAINGSVNVIANGNLGLTTGSSSIDSLLIGATGTVTLGGPAPAAANEPGAGAEPAGGSVAAVPEPATAILLLFGALGLFARRRNVRS
jgi:hypothetical protein